MIPKGYSAPTYIIDDLGAVVENYSGGNNAVYLAATKNFVVVCLGFVSSFVEYSLKALPPSIDVVR